MYTKIGKQKLETKLAELKVQLDETIIERRKAAQEGDLRENAAYHFLGEQAEVIRAQIYEIEDALRLGREIFADSDTSEVRLGHKVKVRFPEGREMDVTLVGKFDSNLKPGWISFESPLAVALLGAKIGEKKQVNDRVIEILHIMPGELD